MLQASFGHHIGQFLEEAKAQREELLDVSADTQLQVTSPGILVYACLPITCVFSVPI